MIRRAIDLHQSDKNSVAFIDLSEASAGPLTPAKIDRSLWRRALGVAASDLASLVAPQQVVLCEGNPSGFSGRAEFDARVYRVIFRRSRPDTEFLSVGACNDVIADSIKLAASLRIVLPGIDIIRLIDRDERTPQAIARAIAEGFRVLSLRSIENYLWSDEILTKLFEMHGLIGKLQDMLAEKRSCLNQSPDYQENPFDDVKHVRGRLHAHLRKVLPKGAAGNDTDSCAEDVLAPLITEETTIYKLLFRELFD